MQPANRCSVCPPAPDVSPGRQAPAAARGSARSRPGCRSGVGGVGLPTTGWSGRHRRWPAPRPVCMRPPIPITWRCCARGPAWRSRRPRQRAAHAGQLLAAICSPLPEPPSTMPRLPGSATVPRGGDAERRIVVVGVVGECPAIDGLVPGLRQVVDDGLLNSKPAWSPPR